MNFDPENRNHQKIYFTGQAMAAIAAHKGFHATQEEAKERAEKSVQLAEAQVKALEDNP